MNADRPNINELPYAEWMEKALQELVRFPVKGICMFATTDNGVIYSNYYKIPMMDKLTIAGLIQTDATTEALVANGQIEPIEEEHN